MLTGGTLIPAYGRDYKNRASIIADLNEGKDFNMQSYNFSGYCSIRDLADGSYQVRNRDMRKVWTVNIKSNVAK